jgi:hypothetical protein
MAGVFNAILNPSGAYNLVINNKIGNQIYFVPSVSNDTNTAVLMDVNAGLPSEEKCFCAAPASTTNVALGYYPLSNSSSVRAYRDVSYTGPYTFWGYDSVVAPSGNFTSFVEQDTEVLRLTLSTSP